MALANPSQRSQLPATRAILKLVTSVLILKVTISVVLTYDDYVPPDFTTDFLTGRSSYFYGLYAWAFYAHIFFGPMSLIAGLILLSERFRAAFPRWHRRLGRVQVLSVIVVATSGLAMATRAQTGPLAGTGFAVLAGATAACVLLGWRAALGRRFREHRRWMSRCYVLLCSAVVLRLMGGLASIAELHGNWAYQAAAWASWLLPLAMLELVYWLTSKLRAAT